MLNLKKLREVGKRILIGRGLSIGLLLFIIVLIMPPRWVGLFQSLPRDARNGNWAEMALTSGHDRIACDMYQMEEKACIVVRVRIVDEEHMVLGYGDTIRWYDRFSMHNLEVLEAYKGEVEVGATIKMLQFDRLQGRSLLSRIIWPLPANEIDRIQGREFSIDYIRLQLNIGDELILFLNELRNSGSIYAGLSATTSYRNFLNYPFFSPTPSLNGMQPPIEQQRFLDSLYVLVNPIQGAFRYTPYVEGGHDTWLLYGVNDNSNLSLDMANLRRR